MNKHVTLLYVDDEPLNLLLFEINFKKKYRVITATSGFEGLEKLQGNHDIIIVISDMKMPGMNGLEFITEARKLFHKNAYFILTAFDINNEIQAALDSKLIHRCFSKPFNIQEIDKAIEAFIQNLA